MSYETHDHVPAGAQIRGTGVGRPQNSGSGRQVHGYSEDVQVVPVAMNNSERRCSYDGEGGCGAFRAKDTAFCIGHARMLGLV